VQAAGELGGLELRQEGEGHVQQILHKVEISVLQGGQGDEQHRDVAGAQAGVAALDVGFDALEQGEGLWVGGWGWGWGLRVGVGEC